jgi:hypothetical protein
VAGRRDDDVSPSIFSPFASLDALIKPPDDGKKL